MTFVLWVLWLMLNFIASARATGIITPGLFLWGFADLIIPSTLDSCSTHPITLIPFNATANSTIGGIAPYYMISFPVGGTPITDFIGYDPSNLSWTITQPVESNLLLSVVDSVGNPGGSPGQLFTVIAGQSTACINDGSSNIDAFTVTGNVSGTLEPCAPWSIGVHGGSSPYTITLVETNSPVVTNITMSFGNDLFTYFNRATAGGQLFAAISDVEGRWASGTQVVTPGGPTDVNCIGLTSSSGDSTLIDAHTANPLQRKKAKNIAILVVALVAIFIVLGGGAVWLIRKRRQRLQCEEDFSRATGYPVSAGEPQQDWKVQFPEKRADILAPPYPSTQTGGMRQESGISTEHNVLVSGRPVGPSGGLNPFLADANESDQNESRPPSYQSNPRQSLHPGK